MGRTLNAHEVSSTKEQSFWKLPSNRVQPEGSKGSFAPAVCSLGILSSRIFQWVPGWQMSTFELWCLAVAVVLDNSCSHFADGNARPVRMDHSSGTGRSISLWWSHLVLVVPCLIMFLGGMVDFFYDLFSQWFFEDLSPKQHGKPMLLFQEWDGKVA